MVRKAKQVEQKCAEITAELCDLKEGEPDMRGGHDCYPHQWIDDGCGGGVCGICHVKE